MAITEEELKRHNQQRKIISQHLAGSWNLYDVYAPDSLPPMLPLTADQFTPENLKDKFNGLYTTLEEFDAPRKTMPLVVSTDPQDVKKLAVSTSGAIHGETKASRHVSPIAPQKKGQFFSSSAPELTLDENIEINYQKRAVSFFHGAILAIQYHPTLTDAQKLKASNQVISVYNRFKDGPKRNGWLENRYEAKWGRKQSYYLKKMLVRMSLTLEDYGLDYKDICSGEMIANLERRRPKEIISEIETPFDDNTYLSSVNITETPLNSQLNHLYLQQQYRFLDSSSGEKTPEWFLALKPVTQAYLRAHKDNPAVPAMPATLRGVPGLANMNLHTAHFKTTKNRGQFNIKHQVIRHGTLTPYDMDNPLERMQAARANGRALADIVVKEAKKNHINFWADGVMTRAKIPVADMSLMSPIDVPFKVFPNEEDLSRRQLNNVGLAGAEHSVYDERYSLQSENNFILRLFHVKKTKDSNLAMKKENRDAYLFGMQNHPEANQFFIQQHNLGINGDRFQESLGFNSLDYQKTSDQTLEQFEQVKKFVEANPNPFRNKENENKFILGMQAADELKRIREQFSVSYSHAGEENIQLSRRINAELFANGLYAMIVQGMGGTVSACCKSTKDRTGLFLLHLDAMHQYYAETGTLIRYDAAEDSPERKQFVDIMVNLYMANTQQYTAGQATLGSAGIKKPDGGLGDMEPLPTDFLKALETKSPGLFVRQKELADANKIKFNVTLSPSKILKNISRAGSWSIWYYEKMLFTVDKIIDNVNDVIDRFKRWGRGDAPRQSL